MRDGAPGSNAMARTRPPTFEGPSDCHLEGCNPAAFSSEVLAASTATARRCSCARKICAALGGPFSSASSARWYSAFTVARSRRPVSREGTLNLVARSIAGACPSSATGVPATGAWEQPASESATAIGARRRRMGY